MLRGLFIPAEVEVWASELRTISRNDDVVVLGGYFALDVITRGLGGSDVHNKNEAQCAPL